MSSPLSAFTVVPNPQMLAFMMAQSFVMMEAAGEAWQYGKRRISAMSNEEFNQLSALKLIEDQTKGLAAAIPTIERAMNQMTPMVGMIIEQYGDFMREIAEHTPQAVANIFSPSGQSLIQQATGMTKEEYDKAAFAWLRNLFPNMPEANAHSIVDEQVKNLDSVGTFKLSTFSSPQTGAKIVTNPLGNIQELSNVRAAELQRQHNAAIAAQKFKQLQSTSFKTANIPTVHQTATQTIKPKAGQTQIIARNGLTKEIARLAALIKTYRQALSQPAMTSQRRTQLNMWITNATGEMHNVQIELTGLLGRYRW